MKSTVAPQPSYEFYFPDSDTLLLVQERDGAVTIRATRDTFSPRRQACFVRELIAEGFIPDHCSWFCSGWPPSGPALRWVVDRSWLVLPAAVLAESRRFMIRALAGGFALWVILMASLFLR